MKKQQKLKNINTVTINRKRPRFRFAQPRGLKLLVVSPLARAKSRRATERSPGTSLVVGRSAYGRLRARMSVCETTAAGSRSTTAHRGRH